MTDKSEAETAELPALTEAELTVSKRNSPDGPCCTDPAYVRYLERQVMSLNASLDSARAVFMAVGAHNAELTDDVAVLSAENRRLESLRSEALADLLRVTREGNEAARALEAASRERAQLSAACDQLAEEVRALRRKGASPGSEGSA